MLRQRLFFLIILIFGIGGLVACRQGGGDRKAAAGGGAGERPYRFTLIIYTSAGTPFWTKVISGAEETSRMLGASTDIQFADNDPIKQNNLIETAIANKADGVGLPICDDNAYDANIKKAMEAGIPVIAFNNDDSQGRAGNARLAYIGQNDESAGEIVARELVSRAGLKAGDFVACPVELPEATYARHRYAGARKVFDKAGIKSELIKTGVVSLEETLNTLAQYLLGRKETKAVLALGQMPMQMTPKACGEAGVKLPNAGFDISEEIARNILEGKTLCAIDQQPYYQGALTVLMLYNHKKYGLLPCDVNTGGALITKENAAAILPLANTVR